MIDTLVVLGAGGDLTGRLLLPAVAGMYADGALAPTFRFLGAGEQDWSRDRFADHVRLRLAAHAPGRPDGVVAAVDYRRVDVTDPADVAAVVAVAGPDPIAVYLALPTRLMLGAVEAVRAAGLPAGSRVAVEKPFGQDLAGAVALNAALAGLDAYRVDHLLAMPAAEPLPQAVTPAPLVELLFEETLALEGRASFYDRAGALRDVMQNHLAQLLCVVAADDPASVTARAEVLRAVRPLSVDDVRTSTRRARYTAGRLADTGGADGRDVPDYADERGVDPGRGTETFAEVALRLDRPGWRDTRLVLRAGKALDRRRRGVRVVPAAGEPTWFDLDDPDDPRRAEPAAYRRLLTDLLDGGSRFAVGAEEAELAWRVFEPVIEGWAADDVPLETYPAGSAGP